MSAAVHVAFDLGAESGRTVAGRFDGEGLVTETVKRFPTRAVRLPDGLYWDALGQFAEISSSLAELHAAGERVSSIGIDTWGVDFGLLDAAGSLVANPRHHRDAADDAALATASARVPRDEV
jgi:rhamnulokinase